MRVVTWLHTETCSLSRHMEKQEMEMDGNWKRKLETETGNGNRSRKVIYVLLACCSYRHPGALPADRLLRYLASFPGLYRTGYVFVLHAYRTC